MALSKKQNIKISIIITFITMVVSMVIHFLYTPFMLDKVGDNQYGLYGFATSALSWLTVAINAILSAYNKITSEEVVKDEENGENRINSVYTFMVIIWAALISIVASIILILMSTGIINMDAYNQEDKRTILILFGIVAIQMIITVATKVATLNITYNNHHVWIKASTLVTTLAAPLISIPFLLTGHGIIVVVSIQVGVNVASHALDIIYDRFVLKKKYRLFPRKTDLKIIGPIFAFCSVIFINEIAYQFDLSVDNLALGLKGYSAQISLYTLALSIVTIASTCSNMIYAPFIPTVFANEANGRREDNLKLYDTLTFAQMSLWLFITGGFISCGKEFVHIWIGEEREVVYYICSALFIIRSVESCAGPSRDMMRASNKHLQRAVLAICVALLNTTLTIILVNVLPKEAAIWGCLIGTAVSCILGWWIVANIMNKKYLKVHTGQFFINFFVIGVITTLSSIVAMRLTELLFATMTNKEYILFLLSGFSFVIIFAIFYITLFRNRLNEILVLLKRK